MTRCRSTMKASLLAAAIATMAVPASAFAQSVMDLKRLTLEELLALEVTVVSRSADTVSDTPAAVFVITQDDIRRSGATSLPELLRLAPGVHVARIDSSRWAIGMRGLADRLSRAMLVLIDGRAVYNPLFAGTYWEVQDLVFDDIERIEIIRGPGGTLWGSNAVNGIISIVTKSARDTQGLFVEAVSGGDERLLASVRYGTTAGSNGHIRGYVKAFNRSPQFHANGLDYDDWWKAQVGLRGDWVLSDNRSLSIQGVSYAARLGARQILTSLAPPYSEVSSVHAPLAGANLLALYSGTLSSGARFDLQTYYDRIEREEQPVGEVRNTLDVDFQQQPPPWGNHQLTWGLGYRVSSDEITAVGLSSFDPPRYTDHLWSAFLQDEFTPVAPITIGVGAKVEHNSYSDVELQPSGRVTWRIAPAHTLVGSVTRAVRTPSRVDTHYTTAAVADPSVPSFVRLVPNEDFSSEKLAAYEIGYRVQSGDGAYITLSGFLNELDDVLSTELLTSFVETTPPPPRVILPVTFANGLHGTSSGFEATADVRPAAAMRTTFSYSYLHVELTRDPGSNDVSQERSNEGRTPHHQARLHMALDLPRNVSLDLFARYVSELTDADIPAYGTAGLRVGWFARPDLELSFTAKDLTDAHHKEWVGGVEVERTAFASLTWRR
ncbi:MAG: TonB-dependent receptor plug domain-containing protein [Vicinamibacterales bacterium]